MWEMHDRLGEHVDMKTCASLIESIRKHGQKQPALGRASLGRDDCEYELIYGARRLFAAQHLGIDLLVELRDFDDRAALIEMDIENRVRTDISPYERGRSYRRWLSGGYFRNQAELAKALAVSEAQVSRLLRYAELPAAVVDAFYSPNDIREEWAVTLAKLCTEPKSRGLVLGRARTWSASARDASAQTVFDTLVNGRGPQSPPECRSRDDVVKDAEGRPLYRIGFRAKSVHLILPRQKMTPTTLQRINEQIMRILAASNGHAALPSSPDKGVLQATQAAPTRMLAPSQGVGVHWPRTRSETRSSERGDGGVFGVGATVEGS
jgi:ParB/RepB/Spo0J family partition protein